MAPDAASSTDPLAGRLVALGRALRLHGIDAGPSELAAAAAVITVLGLEDRERLRSGIAAATLRREVQRETFDQVFDIHFPAAVGGRVGEAEDPAPTDTKGARERAARLRDDLVDALGLELGGGRPAVVDVETDAGHPARGLGTPDRVDQIVGQRPAGGRQVQVELGLRGVRHGEPAEVVPEGDVVAGLQRGDQRGVAPDIGRMRQRVRSGRRCQPSGSRPSTCSSRTEVCTRL